MVLTHGKLCLQGMRVEGKVGNDINSLKAVSARFVGRRYGPPNPNPYPRLYP